MSLDVTTTLDSPVPRIARRVARSVTAKQASLRRSGMTLVRERPGLDFSLTGLIYCCLMLFMGLAANNSQANLLFATFGLMIGILLISGLISRLVVRRLKVRRVLPEHGVVGRPVPASYEITNQKRFWPSLSVSISELDGVQGFTRQPQCYLLHVAPGMTAHVPSELVAKRRGLHEFHRFQLGTSFPFGFIKRAITQRHKEHLVIYPALARVDPRLLTLCRSADLSGPTMRPRSGGSDEFYGVKEFRRGDNPRWIYWRRSARTGVLVSKEMTQVSPPRLLILVDTRLPEPTLPEAVLVEKAIAMAASLAATALDSDLSVGMFAWSNGWVGIPPLRGKAQRGEILSALGRLSSNTEHGIEALLENCHGLLKSGTTPVLFTPRDVQMGFQEEARGGMVIVSAVSDNSAAWFHFEPGIDFETCMPMDQQVPREPAETIGAST